MAAFRISKPLTLWLRGSDSCRDGQCRTPRGARLGRREQIPITLVSYIIFSKLGQKCRSRNRPSDRQGQEVEEGDALQKGMRGLRGVMKMSRSQLW